MLVVGAKLASTHSFVYILHFLMQVPDLLDLSLELLDLNKILRFSLRAPVKLVLQIHILHLGVSQSLNCRLLIMELDLLL